jgi:hypothetical protein
MLESEQRLIATFRRRGFVDHYVGVDDAVDSMLADAGFSCGPDIFDAVEFGNTTEPDLITRLIEVKDIPTKVEAYRQIVKRMDAATKKLRGEIKSVKQRTVLVQDGSSSRFDKLMETNAQLFDRIENCSISIDRVNTELLDGFEEILAIVRETGALRVAFVEGLADKRELMNSHIDLVWKATQNRTVLKLLLCLESCFGRDSLDENPETPPAFLLRNELGALAAKLQEEDALAAAEALALAQEASQAEEAEANEPITATELLGRLTALRRRKRCVGSGGKGSHLRRTDSGLRAQAEAPTKKRPSYEIPKFFAHRPRFEVLHGLALGSEIGGFVVGVDKPFCKTLGHFSVACFTNAQKQSGEVVNGFGDVFIKRLNSLNVLANRLLVKTKESIAVETETVPISDSESQTGDIKKEIAAQMAAQKKK